MEKRVSVPGKTYQDFEIAIDRCADQAYPVRVRSPRGEGHGQLIIPYAANELERRLALIERSLLYSLRKLRRVVAEEERPVQEFGQVLFDALFEGEVRDLYYSSLRELEPNSGLRVRLVIQDPRLAALPWEFLYDPRQHSYVCLSANTPLVRCIDLPRPSHPLEVNFPLRVLGMVAGPRDLETLDVEAEKRNVNEALKDLAAEQCVEVEWLQGATWRDLQQAMWRGPWHVFHFIGHGGYHTERDEGYICLTGADGLSRNLYASDLAMLLGDHPSLRLVVLNACSSARSAGGDMFSSTASTLINAGVPAVLAMQYAISDEAALELARSFYAAVVREIPVESAVAEARKAIRLSGQSLEWAVPVLYSRAADGVLFRGRPPEASALDKPRPPRERSEKRPGEEHLGEAQPRKKKAKHVEAAPAQPAAAHLPAGSGSEPARAEGGPAPEHEAAAPAKKVKLISPDAEAAKKQPAPHIDYEGFLRGIRLALNREVNLDLVYVPAGEFIMGANHAGQDLSPAHAVNLYPYWISRYPITVAAFGLYGQSSSNFPKGPGLEVDFKSAYPVVQLPYTSALGFCAWLNQLFHQVLSEGIQFALPTEAEWEKAARGADKRLYPWGGPENPALANVLESKLNRVQPVDTYPPEAQSPYGCADLCGNVWEMTRSIYARHMSWKLFEMKYVYPFQHTDGRNDSQKRDVLRIARGGSFRTPIRKCSVVERASFEESETRPDLGFRVVLTPLNLAGSAIASVEKLDQFERLLGSLR